MEAAGGAVRGGNSFWSNGEANSKCGSFVFGAPYSFAN
jgi:hypothetical protein